MAADAEAAGGMELADECELTHSERVALSDERLLDAAATLARDDSRMATIEAVTAEALRRRVAPDNCAGYVALTFDHLVAEGYITEERIAGERVVVEADPEGYRHDRETRVVADVVAAEADPYPSPYPDLAAALDGDGDREEAFRRVHVREEAKQAARAAYQPDHDREAAVEAAREVYRDEHGEAAADAAGR